MKTYKILSKSGSDTQGGNISDAHWLLAMGNEPLKSELRKIPTRKAFFIDEQAVEVVDRSPGSLGVLQGCWRMFRVSGQRSLCLVVRTS